MDLNVFGKGARRRTLCLSCNRIDSKRLFLVDVIDTQLITYLLSLKKDNIDRTRAEGKAVVLECAPRQRASRHIAEQAGFSYIGSVERCEVYRLE